MVPRRAINKPQQFVEKAINIEHLPENTTKTTIGKRSGPIIIKKKQWAPQPLHMKYSSLSQSFQSSIPKKVKAVLNSKYASELNLQNCDRLEDQNNLKGPAANPEIIARTSFVFGSWPTALSQWHLKRQKNLLRTHRQQVRYTKNTTRTKLSSENLSSKYPAQHDHYTTIFSGPERGSSTNTSQWKNAPSII